MSALEKMQERITQDARAAADEIMRAATAEAEGLLAQAKATAAQRRDEEVARGAARAEEAHRRILTLAELESRRQALATKAALIDEVFSEAARRLTRVEPATYRLYLTETMLSAVRTGDEEVIMCERDRETPGREVLAEANARLARQGRCASLRLSETVGDFVGGFILKSGNVEVNCTFDAILAKQREAMLVDVARLLFE